MKCAVVDFIRINRRQQEATREIGKRRGQAIDSKVRFIEHDRFAVYVLYNMRT